MYFSCYILGMALVSSLLLLFCFCCGLVDLEFVLRSKLPADVRNLPASAS